MKKFLCLILSLLFLMTFTACGSTPVEDSTKSEINEATEITTTVENEDKDVTDTPAAAEIAFEEITAVDNETCSIRITAIEPDNFWGYTLKTALENKSTDKTLMFSVDAASINGVQCDPFFASEVAAGKKSNEEISFNTSTLTENGIEDFTDIELSFRVYDSNDYTANDAALATIHVYPYGEENATHFVRETQSEDTIVLDNEYATMIVTGYEMDELWGYSANLFLVNKTDKTLMFSAEDVSVNGYMADPFFAVSVAPAKSEFTSISWSDTTFEENGITSVEEIEFLLRIYDYNDWMAEDFANETVTLVP